MSYMAFDEKYYLRNNLDVLSAVKQGVLASGFEHYQNYGWRENRDPNDVFDVSYYRESYRDVALAGIDPLAHFLSFGAGEGRLFNRAAEFALSDGGAVPLVLEFNAAAYLEANRDVASAISSGVLSSAYEHFALYGQFESRGGAYDLYGNVVSRPIYSSGGDDYVGSVTWSATLTDPTGRFGHMEDLLISSAVLAGQQWTNWISSNVNIEVEMIIGSTPGYLAKAASVKAAMVGRDGGSDIFADGALYELVTGVDLTPGSADIRIIIDANALASRGYFSADPLSAGYEVPGGQYDGFGLLMHEIGHGVGINGWLVNGIDDGVISPFDALAVRRGDLFYFMGEAAIGAYGGPVPLTYGNAAHYGNAHGLPGDDLWLGLMSGLATPDGMAYPMANLDIAILKDLVSYTADIYMIA